MKGVTSRTKLKLLLAAVILSSVLCLLVIIRRRRHEKITDYTFFRDDNKYVSTYPDMGWAPLSLQPPGSSGTRSMLTPPWRSRKWRTSSLANTFLLGELSISVNIEFAKYEIYTCFTPYSAPDMKGAPPLPSYLATLLPVLAR